MAGADIDEFAGLGFAPAHDLRIAHIGIDRKHAAMAESACWFPLAATTN
ncbi:hypothetical protein [Aromatoleum diolicum]|uniref:Uncharacterized protein n=1 Tax=Aromatoleum diolicum TaxID=75796 RepID=A0ABX1QI95_9RHOO|nr:hypothetical protein [Aromatoleum diolicum]NMG77236.1 hypothetical protein [Aromatoleum diolicum]